MQFDFTASAFLRVAAVGVYAIVSVGAIVLVESTSSAEETESGVSQSLEMPESNHSKIRVFTSYPVRKWEVRLNGELVKASNNSTHEWSATLDSFMDEAELFIHAPNEDLLSMDPGALKIELWSEDEQMGKTWWGDGSLAVLTSEEEFQH